uniref:Uncharacterized protein n=1 Tax=Setaria digitata TaxID=48799 RepID=A0A915PTZ8_9BILA
MYTSLAKTQNDFTESVNKSSQTDYFEETDPCANCSKLLMSAAEFLTKLELTYGSTPTTQESNLSNFSRSILTMQEPTAKTNVGRYTERKKDNQELVTLISGSAFDNKVKPVVSASPMLQLQRKSSVEKQEETISKLKNGKSKKKPETYDTAKKAIKAESLSPKNRESEQGKKEIAEDNSTKLEATVADIRTPGKMRIKLEKTDEVTAVMPKPKSIYESDQVGKSKRKNKPA